MRIKLGLSILLILVVMLVMSSCKKKTYEVTFTDYDNKVIEVVNVKEGDDATAPKDPVREGYDFDGWDSDFTNVKKNITVTAKYVIKEFKVIFIDYDDKQIGSTQTIKHGENATKPSDPTREGYTFKGWDKPLTNVKSDLILKALYEINVYEVKFLDHDGTQIGETQNVEHGKAATAPANPTRVGHEFTNWDKPFDEVTSDLEITALYETNKYEVMFKDHDGTQLGEIQIVEYGKAAIAPEEPNSIENYHFAKWNKDFDNVTGDLIVTAVYEINKFEVIFIDYDGTQIGDTQIIDYDNDAVAPEDPVREGHNFMGWNGTFTNVKSDLEIMATYKILKYVVIFYDHDRTILKTEKVEYGSEATAPTDPDSKENYHFVGWDMSFDVVKDNLEVTALYKANKYTVLFLDQNEDPIEELTLSVEYGDKIEKPYFYIEGYQLKEWKLKDEVFDFDSEIIELTILQGNYIKDEEFFILDEFNRIVDFLEIIEVIRIPNKIGDNDIKYLDFSSQNDKISDFNNILKEFHIGENLIEINNDANQIFGRSENLTKIIVDENNNYFKDVDGVLYNKDLSTLIIYPNGRIAEDDTFTIIPEVKTIFREAFMHNQSLVTVIFNESIEEIQYRAFYNTNISHLVGTEKLFTLKTIGGNAFYHSPNIEKIYLLKSIETISAGALITNNTNTIIYIETEIKEGWNSNFGIVANQIKYFNFVDFVYIDENDDEVLIERQIVLKGEDAVEPEIPIRNGLHFDGWDKEFENVDNYLKVTANYYMYKVTFTDEDDNVLHVDIIMVSNSKVDEHEYNPSGYKFIEWQLEGVEFDFNTIITEDITLKANVFLLYDYSSLGNNTIRLDKYLGEAENHLVIPSTIDGYDVVLMGNLFAGTTVDYTIIESIELPKNIQLSPTAAPSFGIFLTSLKYFVVDENDENFAVVDGVLFSKDLKTLISYPQNKGTAYEIPLEVEVIGKHAFFNNKTLHELSALGTILEIESYAFAKTGSFEINNFPKTVLRYGSRAFEDSELVEYYLYPQVEYVDAEAFKGMTGTVYLAVEDTSEWHEDWDEGANLEEWKFEVTYKDHENNTIHEEKVFYGDKAKMFYPDLDGYQFIEWKDEFGNNIYDFEEPILRDIVIKGSFISNEEFFVWEDDGEKVRIKKVTQIIPVIRIPEKIDDKIVKNVDELFEVTTNDILITIELKGKEISLDNNVIADLSRSKALENIIVHEDSDKYSVVDGVLYSKEKHMIILFPNNLTFVGDEYEILSSVKIIGILAFSENDTLKSIVLPTGVTKINYRAFYNTKIETFVNIDSLKSLDFIGPEAFYTSKVSNQEFYLHKSFKTILTAGNPIFRKQSNPTVYIDSEIYGDFEDILKDFTLVKFSLVTFIGHDDEVLDLEQIVVHGEDAVAPEVPEVVGYTFVGWDIEFDNITKDLEVKALYEINKYTVTFLDGSGGTHDTQIVEHGKDAVKPATDPKKEGYTFNTWKQTFNNVTSDLTIEPLFSQKLG